MIIGIGTDLCENDRVARLYNRFGERFLNRVYTPEEQDYCLLKKDPIPHLSARFALKEAFIKALGQKRNLTLSYSDVGLKGMNPGKKDIVITGKLKELFEASRADTVFFSISHARNYSTAHVILECRKS